MRKVAVLASSGVESASLLYHYISKNYLVYPLYVRSGMVWEEVELWWLGRLWAFYRKAFRRILPVRVVPFRGGPGPSNTSNEEGLEIPLRNLTLSVASALLTHRKGVSTIAIGSLGIYPFPDNSRDYLGRVEKLLSEGLKREIKIETPFMGMEKWEVVKEFYGKVPYRLTFSCASPVGRHHCGRCAKCKERQEGFSKADVPDPTYYLS